MWRGEHPERPFLLLISRASSTRAAPAGKHTAYAYCHRARRFHPRSDRRDRASGRALPGFTADILARHAMNTAGLVRHNPNYVGGAISAGSPICFSCSAARCWLNPHPPHPRLFICSASTLPAAVCMACAATGCRPGRTPAVHR